MSIIRAVVLGAGYIFLAIGFVPGLRMNRASIALVFTATLIGIGAISLNEAWVAIDSSTIVFLLSMMIINAYLSYAGFFQLSLTYLLSISRSPLGILVLLTVGTGVLSAFFLNDTLAIVATPIALQLTRCLCLNPIPYLLAIAGATNIGSLATLNGNPQNILIGSFSGISYLSFIKALTPIAIAGLIIQIGLLIILYPEVRSLVPRSPSVMLRRRIHRPLLIKSVAVTVILLGAFTLGFPLAESAFAAAAVLLVTRRIKSSRVLLSVDWSLLVMFSGLFILTRCVQSLDNLQYILQVLKIGVQDPLGLFSITAILSNLISNVPTVLLLKSLIAPSSDQAWLLLAASSTLAGNLTLFGSVANLIVVEAASRESVNLTFMEHIRFGIPLTLITLGIAYGWIIGH
ncbi:Na+/H+ antiporter NhaD-like permease [Synechococcus sp. PCC 7502]|uniref:anion transporter n=1 Tax=Synechococcus sp. PCC 7502 TaxID=1173263 RepID=UPI00029F9E93|nr:anion transporter [Synechococcus sp. PCC 7502]AFY74997.1 Na+/H+ antiporter NhaD-like permease [Synechococcus sp. PCC 7502]